ncbi:hypothetical protein [Paenibacillus motobuensis]|uniref:EamA domain-containing protein n=1 Tax=Paenibacillus motobuensis TaxID=295324 RepID=A0ABP3I5J9_9BACL
MNKIGITFGVTIILFVYGGSNLYIGRKFFQWLKLLFPSISGTIFALIYGFLALSLIMGVLPLPTVLKGTMGWIGSYWMGIFICSF